MELLPFHILKSKRSYQIVMLKPFFYIRSGHIVLIHCLSFFIFNELEFIMSASSNGKFQLLMAFEKDLNTYFQIISLKIQVRDRLSLRFYFF